MVRVQAHNRRAISYNLKLGYKIDFEDARDCRSDRNKCGYYGLYFEPLSNLKLKMLAVKLNEMTSKFENDAVVVVWSIWLLTIFLVMASLNIFFFQKCIKLSKSNCNRTTL